MRVLFVNPPVLPSGAVPPPLSIATLAAYVGPSCTSVRVFDGDLIFFDPAARTRHVLRERLTAELKEFRPDAVLVTSMYNNSAIAGLMMATVKAVDDTIKVLGGGPHFGAQPKETLRAVEYIDYVIAGEGEAGLKALIEAWVQGSDPSACPNLAWRENGAFRQNPKGELLDLSSLPNVWAASAGALNLQAYRDTISQTSPHRSIYTEAGRGCPYNCNFCAPAQFWDRRYRVKTPDQIAEELRYLHTAYGYDAFILVHDLLMVDPRFVRTLSKRIGDLRLPIRWMANSRTDLKHARDFDNLAKSGCWRLFYGVDSGSARIQRVMNKELDPDEAFDVVQSAVLGGVGAVCSFVVGHPEETAAELSASILLGARLKVAGAENVQFHRLRLFPPAPLAVGEKLTELLRNAELDETTLRLEYPLPEITAEERATIERNPRFYAGYFPPASKAGTAEEISQVELFFTQAIAFAPLTVYTLGQMSSVNIVELFQAHLAGYGFIDRYVFNPSDISIPRNWAALKTRLEAMAAAAELDVDEAALVSALLDYEDSRMRFVHRQPANSAAILWQDETAVTRSKVAVDRVIEAMLIGGRPDPSMRAEVTMLFKRGSDAVVVVG
ncbi:radical SAM protein [Mesorhizobium sp. M0859]|uniref:B12-binding domain-containing radical SAM protein n=1 Tax=Mesorhizobium sp. M0859 TaxID=2957014 RepID=UPI003336C1E3